MKFEKLRKIADKLVTTLGDMPSEEADQIVFNSAYLIYTEILGLKGEIIKTKDITACGGKTLQRIIEYTFKEEVKNMSETMGLAAPTAEDIHLLRKNIDSVIQSASKLQVQFGRANGGREISLVVTKLQEGKMWAGKILEAIGSELPKEFQDKAE